jgi:glycosyltransferase involved in cell wall biosynthesis
MSEGVAVLVPVLNRPQNVRPLMEAIAATTTVPYRVLFLCDVGDRAERDAIAVEGGWMLSPSGTYASKINVGVRETDEPFVLLAADDVLPHPGWFEAARAAMARGAQVIGLNDLIERPTRPQHATHFLLTRAAAELPCIDGSPGPLCERYMHWRTDDELIATATKRGMYAYAADAIVEHVNHPMIGGADDDTYRKGRARARQDGRTFMRRSRLWM